MGDYRLVVDRTSCSGHGRCYALAEELFDCDDEGLPIVLVEELSDGDASMEAARQAVDRCPERAISLQPAE